MLINIYFLSFSGGGGVNSRIHVSYMNIFIPWIIKKQYSAENNIYKIIFSKDIWSSQHKNLMKTILFFSTFMDFQKNIQQYLLSRYLQKY